MRVGITGHQKLRKPADWPWVRSEVGHVLDGTTAPLVGISSLAVGSDQIFAQLVLERGGNLEAVIPFPEYETRFDDKAARELYLTLVERAARTTVLNRVGTDEECYYAAGKYVVDSCELLVAVWDGRSAKGLGGTADIVTFAKSVRRKAVHIHTGKLVVSSLGPSPTTGQ